MTDPVMADDGYTNQRSGIENWFEGHSRSHTNKNITNKRLVVNQTHRSDICACVDDIIGGLGQVTCNELE